MNDPASTVPVPRDAGHPDPLGDLRREYPAYVVYFEPDRFGREPRYVAVARDIASRVNCVISADPAEVAAALAGGAA